MSSCASVFIASTLFAYQQHLLQTQIIRIQKPILYFRNKFRKIWVDPRPDPVRGWTPTVYNSVTSPFGQTEYSTVSSQHFWHLRAFSVAVPKVWNSLPDSLRDTAVESKPFGRNSAGNQQNEHWRQLGEGVSRSQ